MDSTHPNGHDAGHGHGRKNSPASRTTWVFWGFVAVAAFFLLTEHRAHLFGILPFLLLLACPLLHFFHHGRHGGHGEGRQGDEAQSKSEGGRQ